MEHVSAGILISKNMKGNGVKVQNNIARCARRWSGGSLEGRKMQFRDLQKQYQMLKEEITDKVLDVCAL